MKPDDLFRLVLTTLIGGFVGSYLSGYFKKKGEIVALTDELSLLVEQAEATTNATKNIEARISNEFWQKQQHWELKRDTLIQAAKRVVEADQALSNLFEAYVVPPAELPISRKAECRNRWFEIAGAIEETRMLFAVVCSGAASRSFDDFAETCHSLALTILERSSSPPQIREQINSMIKKIKLAIREEIGISDSPGATVG